MSSMTSMTSETYKTSCKLTLNINLVASEAVEAY